MMADYETITRLDLMVQQNNEIIRVLRELLENQKERMAGEKIEEEPEPVKEIKPKAKWPDRKIPRQEPQEQSFDENDDVEELTLEEMQELQKQKRVL